MKSTSVLKKNLFCLFLFITVYIYPSTGQSPGGNPNVDAGGEIALPIIQYMAGLRDLYRAYNDMTYTLLFQKETNYLDQWEDRLKKIPFDHLSQEGKVDYLLFHNTIEKNKYALAQQQKVWNALQPALPFSHQILRLVRMRHWGRTPNAKFIAATYDSIGHEIIKTQEQLGRLDLSAVHSLPAAMSIVQSLKDNLQQVYQFYAGYNPSFTWWVQTSFETTDSLFENYIDTLHDHIYQQVASHDGSGIPGVPVGLERIKQYLRFEMIPYSPQELIQIADEEYAWCLKEIKNASAEMGYKDDWKAALEAVKNDYVPVGEQPALIDSLQNEALDFVSAHHLIEIPPLAKETWTMKMMSPQEQLINPFFYGGLLISISYPTNTMSYKDKLESMRGNNIYFSRATVFHELLPGHYLQVFMRERYRPYRRPFHTAFWTEGWAFYWEMLLWDNGFDQTPEQKIGALYWRMTRCARIVFTLNFHLKKWTPGQCVNYLVDSAGLEPANARAEVRRSFGGEYDPLYQIAYMIGALQFRALHHELVDGGKLSNNAFHQMILEENNMPIEMLRALMEHIPVQKNYQPAWKFYAEIAPNETNIEK